MSAVTKALVAALVLASVSTVIVPGASATPFRGGWSGGSDAYMAPRHDPTNTNGNWHPIICAISIKAQQLRPLIVPHHTSCQEPNPSKNFRCEQDDKEAPMSGKITKVLAAAPVLAGVAAAMVADASAARRRGGWHRGHGYFAARHDPTNTNGN
jgi:hypothetical protein